MQVSGHFLPLEYSCCNLLHNCKDKLFTPAFGLLGQRFCGTLQNLCFFPPPFRFIPLLFIVGIRYDEATFAALIRGGCRFAVFCRCVSFVRFARSVIVFRAIQTTFAGVQLYSKTV